VRTAVEDDAAVWTEEVCEAGSLPARVECPRRRRHVLVAEAAFQWRSNPLVTILGLENPWPELERRLVAHVLLMAARELGDPVALCVQVETDNRTLHAVSVRAVAGHTADGASELRA
jgi:hypothetical protein